MKLSLFTLVISLNLLMAHSSKVVAQINIAPEEPGAMFASDLDDSYVLGPGDRLLINFFNVSEYDGEEQILVDGSINLPLIGKFFISGLTIDAAEMAMTSAYGDYLRTPLINLDIVAPRPIRVGIAGEVNRPGMYDIQLVDNNSEGIADWPTLLDAIKESGGITNQADIRAVEIRRSKAGSVDQLVSLDLWNVLATGILDSDITLRDGDAIYVPKTSELTPEELTKLSSANFAPDSILITVVGEVANPGAINLPPNAPLNQAVLASGGFDPQRANIDDVQLVRLNSDGTVSQQQIIVDFEQGINDINNPSLRNNDIVVVGRSGTAAFSDDVESLGGPLSLILSPLQLLINLLR